MELDLEAHADRYRVCQGRSRGGWWVELEGLQRARRPSVCGKTSEVSVWRVEDGNSRTSLWSEARREDDEGRMRVVAGKKQVQWLSECGRRRRLEEPRHGHCVGLGQCAAPPRLHFRCWTLAAEVQWLCHDLRNITNVTLVLSYQQ